MKKLLRLLLTFSFSLLPVTAVVACANDKNDDKENIETAKDTINNILKSKAGEWELSDLQSEIDNNPKLHGIKVGFNNRKEENSKIKDQFSFEADSNSSFKGEMNLNHIYIDNRKNIDNLKGELQSLLDENKSSSWNINKLQNIVNSKFIKDKIKVILISEIEPISSIKEYHHEWFEFSALEVKGANYKGTLNLKHNWITKKDISKNISAIKSKLQSLLDENKTNSWNINELQNKVNSLYPDENIEVVSIAKPQPIKWENENHSESFKFIANQNSDDTQEYIGSIILDHSWITRKDISNDISVIKADLQSLLDENKTSSWNINELQAKVNSLYPDENIEVVSIAKPQPIKWENENHSESFKFIANQNNDDTQEYIGSIILNHNWITKEDVSNDISVIKSNLQSLLDENKSNSWNINELQNKVNSLYPDENIEVVSIAKPQPIKWENENHSESFKFIANQNSDDTQEYIGSIILDHSWTTKEDITINIKDIKHDIESILNKKQTQSWTLSDLQMVINAQFPIDKIKVIEIDKPKLYEWKEETTSEWFEFIGIGSKYNDFNYEGIIDLEHKYKTKKESTKDILEIKNDLQKIVDLKESESWDIEELQRNIKLKYKNDNITVERILKPQTRSSGIVKHEEWFKITGHGSKDNHEEYKNSVEIKHHWNAEEDTSIDIKTIEKELKEIIEDHSKKYQPWKENELESIINEKWSNSGIQIKINKLNNLTRENINMQEEIILTGIGNINNTFIYKGELKIVHHWEEYIPDQI